VHRELVSALSMPTGFKNSTDGSVGIAIDACRAASAPHVFLSVGKEGLSSIVETEVSQVQREAKYSDQDSERATRTCT
jgi:phospho-2-dehydro-3-deoxyheptonate aldolase